VLDRYTNTNFVYYKHNGDDESYESNEELGGGVPLDGGAGDILTKQRDVI